MYLGSLKRRKQRAFNGSKIIIKLPRTAKCQHKTWRSIKISTHYFFWDVWQMETENPRWLRTPAAATHRVYITMLWCVERPQTWCSVDDWTFRRCLEQKNQQHLDGNGSWNRWKPFQTGSWWGTWARVFVSGQPLPGCVTTDTGDKRGILRRKMSPIWHTSQKK